MSAPLFRQLLGASFDALPATIQILHAGSSRTFTGRCDVERGQGALSRVFARITSLPAAGKDQPITVTISCNECGEVWTRQFSKNYMTSSLSAQGNSLVEWLGPVRFKFKLDYDSSRQCIDWRLIRVAAFGIPLPVSWFDKVKAQESSDNGKYCFDVSAALPLIGMLVQYRGWLDVN